MSEPPDELYFPWLYAQVASVNIADPSRTYWELLRKLYNKEFIWFVPNDDNRAEDGRELRLEFVTTTGAVVDGDWLRLGCSVLELLIALSRRLCFETDIPEVEWFWEMLENLGLDQYNDSRPLPEARVDAVLDRFIWRVYRRNGRGGLFPLKRSSEDQTKVEIWYQMSAYILQQAA